MPSTPQDLDRPERAGTHALHRTDRVAVEAPADAVYELLTDLAAWPTIFPTFVHLEVVDHADGVDHVRVWTTSSGVVESWTLYRATSPTEREMTMSPEHPHPPVTAMTRAWQVLPTGPESCEIVLRHDVSAPTPEDCATLEPIVGHIADQELAALSAAAEQGHRRPELTVVVEDTVTATGDAGRAAEFLADPRLWPGRLSHVLRTAVEHFDHDAQLVETETLERSGATLTTRVARVCLPDGRIVFRHLVLPPIGRCHQVLWQVRENGGQVEISARQDVVVDPEGAAAMLGEGTDLVAATGFVRSELSAKVRLMLDGAAAYAAASPAP